MPLTLAAATGPLCGLRFTHPALLELRDDHRRQPPPADQPEGTTR